MFSFYKSIHVSTNNTSCILHLQNLLFFVLGVRLKDLVEIGGGIVVGDGAIAEDSVVGLAPGDGGNAGIETS